MMSPINFRNYFPGVILAVATAMVALNSFSMNADGYKVKQVQVIESFFSQKDIDDIFENQKIPKVASWLHEASPGTSYGASYMTKGHVNRFLEAAGAAEDGAKERGQYIMIKKMTSTTGMHKDEAIMADGSLEVPLEKGAFVFLNSNPQAMFTVEGEDPVPVRAGDLVIFPGGQVRHQTVIDSGYVQIAGPFAASPETVILIGERSLQVTILRSQVSCEFIKGARNFFENIIFFILRVLGFITDEIIDECGRSRRELAHSWLRHGLHQDDLNGQGVLEA